MLVLPQKVEVKWNSKTKEHYESRGYTFTRAGDKFKVNVDDLTSRNTVEVLIQCDYCKNQYKRKYHTWKVSNEKKKIKKDACEKCKGKLITESKMIYNYKIAKEKFKEDGYTLLIDENDYIDSQTDMPCICSNGHETKIGLSNFLCGRRCKFCRYEEKADKDRHDYEHVKQVFENNGFILLSYKYNNTHEKLECLCSCGNKTKMSFHNVNNGHKCIECRSKTVADMRRTPYDEVKYTFETENCVLLSESYENQEQKLDYICSCGNKSKISYNKFKMGRRCKKCATEKIKIKLKNKYEYVKQIFEDDGCILLSKEYENYQTPLEYICHCGEKANCTLNNFTKIYGCLNCRVISNGEERIKDFLIKNNIDFKRQYKFDDCKNKNKLPFDFAIFTNKKLDRLIEYDGEHHFKEIEHWGGKDHFERTKNNDEIKNNYCKENNINLHRIPYWELDNVEFLLHTYII